MIDAWRIGVRLVMTSNSPQVLSAMLRGLTGVELGAKRVNEQFRLMKNLAIASGAVFGGKALFGGLNDLVKHGAKIADIQAKMAALNISAPDIQAATGAAFEEAKAIRGTTPAGNLEAILELRGLLKNTKEAIAALPAYLRTEFDLGIYNNRTASGEMLALVKGMDLKGGFVKNGQLDVGAFSQAVRSAEAALELTNGLLTGKSFYQFTRMAGPAAAAMNTEQYLKDFTEIIMGLGSTGGRGLQMAAKTFLGGQVTKANVQQLRALGLIGGEGVGYTVTSGHYALKPGALKGYDELLNKGFAQWFHDVVEPAMTAHHFKGPAAVLQALSSLPVTEQRVFSFMFTNWPQIAKFEGQFDKRASVDANKALQSGSYTANLRDFHAAWEGLMEALGQAAVPDAIKIMHGLTTAVLGLEAAAVAHPEAAKAIIELTGVLSGLLLVGGGLGVATFALRGFGSSLSLFKSGSAAATALETLGAPATVGGSLLSFASGVGEVAAAVAGAYYAFKGWHDLNQKEPTTTGLKNPAALPTIGSHAAPDHGLPRVLPHHLLFGAMPPPPTTTMLAVPPSKIMVPPSLLPGATTRPSAVPSHVHHDNPLPVHVVGGQVDIGNTRDIATGVTGHIVSKSRLPPAGYSGLDLRADPWSAGMQAGVP